MINQEDVGKLKELLVDETLLLMRSFQSKSIGYFFVSPRDNEHAPFRMGGYCPRDGVYEGFIAFGDFEAAKNLIKALDLG